MRRKPSQFYFYGAPTSMGPSLILAAGMGELLGQLIVLPFKTPFYVIEFVKKLRSNSIVQEKISSLSAKDQEEKIRKSLYELKHKKFISYCRKEDGTIELCLTLKGKKYFKRISLQALRINPPVQWDGKWRMVIFDIPEKERLLRDMFRDRLRQMGFFQIQKSVWVHPFECESEIRFLMQQYKVETYILFYTITIENDEQLKKYFKLN